MMVGPFSLVYADPPWSYRDKANAGERGAAHQYPTMSVDEVCALPVATRLAAADSVLALWAPSPLLVEPGAPVHRVIDAWDFRGSTVGFCWVKRGESGALAWGMGGATRANVELCIFARRGRGVKRRAADVHQVIEAPAGAHSEKPAEARDRLVRLFGDVPRVELFARHAVDGWHRFGNDAAPGRGNVAGMMR